jgi:Uma2 family endonuclease
MRPIGIRHIICVNRTGKIIGRALGDDLILSVQNPIRLSNDGMPQPDLAVFADRGADAPMPTDGEVLLVIEVSDSTRDNDRQAKLPLYAVAGIPEAWFFDLVTETIKRHSAPIDGRYTLIAVSSPGRALASTIIPGLSIPANVIPPKG